MIALDEAPLTQSLQCLWRGKGVVGQRYNANRKGKGSPLASSPSSSPSEHAPLTSNDASNNNDTTFINEVPIDMCIPPTVVFEHNFPKGLYFADPITRRMSRRVGRDVDSTICYEALLNVEETFGWGNSNNANNNNGGNPNSTANASLSGGAAARHSTAASRDNSLGMGNSKRFSSLSPAKRDYGSPSANLVRQAASQEEKLPGKHAHAKGGEADIIAMFVEFDTEERDADVGGDGSSSSALKTLNTSNSPQRTKGDKRPVVRTHYFTEAGLRLFLLSSSQNNLPKHSPQMIDAFTTNNKNGILQRFIYPIGRHSEMIQVLWTPQMFFVEKCQSKAVLGDVNLTPFQRAATFEAPDNFTVKSFVSPAVYEKLREECDSLIANLASIERKGIANAVLFFKVDAYGTLWYLFMTQVTFTQPLQHKGPQKRDLINGTTTTSDGNVSSLGGGGGVRSPYASKPSTGVPVLPQRTKKEDGVTALLPTFALPISIDPSRFLAPIKLREFPPVTRPSTAHGGDVTNPAHQHSAEFSRPATSSGNTSRRQRAVSADMLHPNPTYRMVKGGLFTTMGEDQLLKFGKDLRVDFCGAAVDVSRFGQVCPTAAAHHAQLVRERSRMAEADPNSTVGGGGEKGGNESLNNTASNLNVTVGSKGLNSTSRSTHQSSQQHHQQHHRSRSNMPMPLQPGSILTDYHYDDDSNPFLAPLVASGSLSRGQFVMPSSSSRLFKAPFNSSSGVGGGGHANRPSYRDDTVRRAEGYSPKPWAIQADTPLDKVLAKRAAKREGRGGAGSGSGNSTSRSGTGDARNDKNTMASGENSSSSPSSPHRFADKKNPDGAVGTGAAETCYSDSDTNSDIPLQGRGPGALANSTNKRRKRSLRDVDDAIAKEPPLEESSHALLMAVVGSSSITANANGSSALMGNTTSGSPTRGKLSAVHTRRQLLSGGGDERGDNHSLATDHIAEAAMLDRIIIESKAGKRALLKMARDRMQTAGDGNCEENGANTSTADVNVSAITASPLLSNNDESSAAKHATFDTSSSEVKGDATSRLGAIPLLSIFPEEVTAILTSSFATEGTLLIGQCGEPLLRNTKMEEHARRLLSQNVAVCDDEAKCNYLISKYIRKRFAARRSAIGAVAFLLNLLEVCTASSPSSSASLSSSAPPSFIFSLPMHPSPYCMTNTARDALTRLAGFWIQRLANSGSATQNIVANGGDESTSPTGARKSALKSSKRGHTRDGSTATSGSEKDLSAAAPTAVNGDASNAPFVRSSSLRPLPSTPTFDPSIHIVEGFDAMLSNRIVAEAVQGYVEMCLKASMAEDTETGDRAAPSSSIPLATAINRSIMMASMHENGIADNGQQRFSGVAGGSLPSSVASVLATGASRWAVDSTSYFMLWRRVLEAAEEGAKTPNSNDVVSTRLPRCYAVSAPKPFAFALRSRMSTFITVTLRSAIDAADAEAESSLLKGNIAVAEGEQQDTLELRSTESDGEFGYDYTTVYLSSPSSNASHPSAAAKAATNSDEIAQASRSENHSRQSGASSAAKPIVFDANTIKQSEPARSSADFSNAIVAKEVADDVTSNAPIVRVTLEPLTPPPQAIAKETIAEVARLVLERREGNVDGDDAENSALLASGNADLILLDGAPRGDDENEEDTRKKSEANDDRPLLIEGDAARAAAADDEPSQPLQEEKGFGTTQPMVPQHQAKREDEREL